MGTTGYATEGRSEVLETRFGARLLGKTVEKLAIRTEICC